MLIDREPSVLGRFVGLSDPADGGVLDVLEDMRLWRVEAALIVEVRAFKILELLRTPLAISEDLVEVIVRREYSIDRECGLSGSKYVRVKAVDWLLCSLVFGAFGPRSLAKHRTTTFPRFVFAPI